MSKNKSFTSDLSPVSPVSPVDFVTSGQEVENVGVEIDSLKESFQFSGTENSQPLTRNYAGMAYSWKFTNDAIGNQLAVGYVKGLTSGLVNFAPALSSVVVDTIISSGTKGYKWTIESVENQAVFIVIVWRKGNLNYIAVLNDLRQVFDLKTKSKIENKSASTQYKYRFDEAKVSGKGKTLGVSGKATLLNEGETSILVKEAKGEYTISDDGKYDVIRSFEDMLDLG